MRSVSHQSGFDFSDATQPLAAEDPPGTWLSTYFTSEQYRLHIPQAKTAVTRLDPLLQQLFTNAIDQIEPRLNEIATSSTEEGGAYHLWGIELRVPSEV